MSEDKLNPDYRGEKCPTCGERVPWLFERQCSACNALELKRAKATIERLIVRLNALADAANMFVDFGTNGPEVKSQIEMALAATEDKS